MMDSSQRPWTALDYGSRLDQIGAVLAPGTEAEGTWKAGCTLALLLGTQVIGTSAPLLSWASGLLISHGLWLGFTDSKTFMDFLRSDYSVRITPFEDFVHCLEL
jgi:hypothetical protein